MKHSYKVTLEADMNEPALTGAAFDLLRLHARACGLPDVGHVYVHLSFDVEGRTHRGHIDELKARLSTLWLGQVSKVEVDEEVPPASEAAA